jgi:D-serine deaminase-like pyridoxal phosphate-dependent protein
MSRPQAAPRDEGLATLSSLQTPSALIDLTRMQANIARMQSHMDSLGVRFRPHAKTTKCLPVVQAQLAAGAQGITVSTLQPGKLAQALALRRRGAALTIITDSITSANAIVEFGKAHGETFEVLIEIDVDGHRSGVQPDSDVLLQIGRTLHNGGMRLLGVMAHAGSSYDCDDPEALRRITEQERRETVRAADRLRHAGLPCPVVSIGSTPTAIAAQTLEGVTEVRAGVYVLFDLVMHNVGVCSLQDIALSVLTTVIGHQEEKGWAIIDAGWMAMSRDRGTHKQRQDFGYGQVCTEDGAPIAGYVISGANQEHGIVSLVSGTDMQIADRFPIGTRLRVLPNHACATGAQHPQYEAVSANGEVQSWPRFYGW